jgi:probable addiction module antidote protein
MKSSKFDIAEYLDDEEMINEYLNTVLEEGDSNDIQVALGHIAKAIGMSKIAEQTGMSRPSLYKALAENAKLQFDTILKVLRAIGGNIKMKPSIYISSCKEPTRFNSMVKPDEFTSSCLSTGL